MPGHVERELLSYLACGIPAHGFALLRCDACDGSHVVPFSCKGRGFCPSCGGRWMSQTAAHLVDRLFPEVPVRQWVLTLPMPLRFWLARRPRLCRQVLAVFLRGPALDEGMENLDSVVERLPAALEERNEQIDRVLTTMLVGLVREVDVRAIVYEQLETVTTEQLGTGFREFSDDKLAYITLLGGLFGVIGGTVIVFPLPAIGSLVGIGILLTAMDVLAARLMRIRWWNRLWRRDEAAAEA